MTGCWAKIDWTWLCQNEHHKQILATMQLPATCLLAESHSFLEGKTNFASTSLCKCYGPLMLLNLFHTMHNTQQFLPCLPLMFFNIRKK
jgi:hypothetical protein